MLDDLLAAWAAGSQPIHCRVFQGAAQHQVRAWAQLHPDATVDFEFLPWLSQDEFDAVLWSCDFNLVRGEDSFVRAQWAGRPMLWDIYPQQDEAHIVKMEAFLRRYRSGMPEPAAQALAALWQAWVRKQGAALSAAWAALLPHGPALRRHAERWCDAQASRPDLLTALLQSLRQ